MYKRQNRLVPFVIHPNRKAIQQNASGTASNQLSLSLKPDDSDEIKGFYELSYVGYFANLVDIN